jgi:hypothetical protein
MYIFCEAVSLSTMFSDSARLRMLQAVANFVALNGVPHMYTPLFYIILSDAYFGHLSLNGKYSAENFYERTMSSSETYIEVK